MRRGRAGLWAVLLLAAVSLVARLRRRNNTIEAAESAAKPDPTGAGAPGQASPDMGPRLLALGAAFVAALVPLVALPAISSRPDLAPLVFVAAAVGIGVLVRPQWLVPAYAAFTWMAIGASYFGGLSPVEVAGLALLAVAAVNALARREVAVEALVVMALLGLPVVAASLLSAEQPGVSPDRFRDLSFIFLIALTLPGLAGVERTVTLLTAVGMFLGVGAAYSVLVEPTGLFPLQVEGLGVEASRAAGPFQEANFFALSMAALLPCALYVGSRGGAWRALGFPASLCLLAGVLATGSRGGLAASFAGVILFGLWARQRRLMWASLAVSVTTVAVLLPVFATQVESSTRRPVSGRATENRIAVAMFADHPLTGIGPGQFEDVYRDYSRMIGNDPRPERESHSLVLQVAAEQGVVGLAGLAGAMLALLAAVRRRAAQRIAVGRALLCSLGAYAVGSLFLHGSQLRLPYLLIGMLLALDGSSPRRPNRPA